MFCDHLDSQLASWHGDKLLVRSSLVHIDFSGLSPAIAAAAAPGAPPPHHHHHPRVVLHHVHSLVREVAAPPSTASSPTSTSTTDHKDTNLNMVIRTNITYIYNLSFIDNKFSFFCSYYQLLGVSFDHFKTT